MPATQRRAFGLASRRTALDACSPQLAFSDGTSAPVAASRHVASGKRTPPLSDRASHSAAASSFGAAA